MLIEEQVVKYFSEKGLMLASAESCTGGLISKRITDISGASAMFGFGLCTYANIAKIKLLNVNPKTLEKYGAVSYQTAYEMAEGLLKLSDADISVCTTGMASPSTNPTEKKVGTVFVGIGSKKNGVRVIELSLGDLVTRDNIRNASVDRALAEVLCEARSVCEG